MRTLILMVALPFATARAQSAAKLHAEIANFNDSLSAATRRMDNAATLALWADDGVSIMPNQKAIVGKAAITAFLDNVMKSIAGSRMESFAMRCFETSLTTTVATEWCIEHQIVRLADSTTFDGWGKMSFVLRRSAAGQWRMVQETWVASQAEPELLTKNP